MQKVSFSIFLFISFVLSQQLYSQQNLDREIATIINPLIASIQSQSIKNVAIADFTLLDGTPTELGKYLAEEFSFSLVNAPDRNFVLIDRSRVSALLKENGMASTGMLDPNTIAKLGKMKGIDAVIAGTLTSTGNTLRLIIKVWNLETQGLVAASKGDISKTPMIIDLEGKVITASPSTVADPKPTAAPLSKFSEDNLTFELLSCKQVGQVVQCQIRIKSSGKDSNLNMLASYANSRLFASSGNEYKLSEIKLGDITSKTTAKKSLVSDIPIKCTLSFSAVTEKISYIPKIELRCYQDGSSYFQLEFRNIKVD
jgi:hypothetical protein